MGSPSTSHAASPAELEHAGWDALCAGEGRRFYDEMLADDAIFVVPGAVLDRAATLASWDGVPPWKHVEFSGERVVDLTDDVVIVTYAATATRDDPATEYRAQFTTEYVKAPDGTWRIGLHQQTPVPAPAPAPAPPPVEHAAPASARPLLRRLFRAPVALYRWHLGWLLDHRFVLLVHRGRRTGTAHCSVLEVVHFNRTTDEVIVMSGFGPHADWYRNVVADPDVEIEIGRRRFPARARKVGDDEAVAVLGAYERRYPYASGILRRVISRLVGWRYTGSDADRLAVVRELPMISFTPR